MVLLLVLSNLILGADEQAYTHELEIKVSRLEEENERLRRQKVMFCSLGPYDYTCIDCDWY